MPYVSDGTNWNLPDPPASVTVADVWDKLSAGARPTATAHGNAGDGPTITVTGTRLNPVLTITTGANPTSFGQLATLTVSGYAAAPYAAVAPADAQTAATFPYCTPVSATEVQLAIAGQIEPGTTYTYRLTIMGA